MNSLTSAAASFIRSADEGLRDRVSIYTSCSVWFVTFGLLLTLSNIHRLVGFCRVFIDSDFLCVLWVLFASLPVFSSVFVTDPADLCCISCRPSPAFGSTFSAQSVTD